MDSTPLIAKCAKPCRNDCVSLCKEIFSENYKKYYNTDNLNNLVEYRTESDDIKLCALTVNQVHLKNKISMKCIEEVEEHIILRKSDFVIGKDYIEENDILKEKIILKPWQTIMDLPQGDVNKYGLIQKEDILPNIVLQTLEFPQDGCMGPHKPGPNNVGSKKYINRNNDKTELFPEIKSKSFKYASMDQFLEKEYEQSFRILPDPCVFFYNYKRKVIYKKIIFIQNTSKDCSNSVLLIEPPITNYFKISCFDGDNKKVAPGLSVRYSVTFQSDYYLNIVDKVVFRVTNLNSNFWGRRYDTLTLQLYSYRESPLLRGIVIKACLNFDKFTLNYSKFSKDRAKALCETIDCGHCFKGGITTAHLILRNYGSTATFAVISEMEWFLCSIMNLTIHNELVLPSFIISPAYFKLKYGEYIDISINFGPTNFGLFCENLYMLSNNNTAERLDLVADGIIFHRNTIEVTNVEFKHLTKSDLTDPDVKLDFGMCLFQQTVTKQIILTNRSCVPLKYRVALEDCNMREGQRLLQRWLSINTSGLIPEFGSSVIDVKLEVGYNIIGKHAVNLIVIVMDIPDTAIDIASECLVKETHKNAIGTQMLEINMFAVELVCTIYEMYLQLMPAELSLQLLPDISRFTHVQCHIRFETNGLQTLHCTWTVPCNSYVSIDPVDFELTSTRDPVDNSFQDCYILVAEEALKAGTFKCILTINAGRELIFEMNLSTDIFPADTPNWSTANIMQINITDEKAAKCHRICSDKDFHLIMHYAQPQETLNSEVFMDSINEEFIIDVNVKQQTSNSFVEKTTVEEKFHLHSTQSCFNILFVQELLYIGQVWRTQICLHNYSNYSTKYIWAFMSGKQRILLDINVIPEHGTLLPLSCTRFDVYIKAKVPGIFEDIYLNCFIGIDEEKLQMRVLCAVEDISCKITLPDDEKTVVVWPLIVHNKEEERYSSTSVPMELTIQDETNEAHSQLEFRDDIDGDIVSLQSEESGSQSEYWKAVPPPSLVTVVNDEASTNFTSEVNRLNDHFSINTSNLTRINSFAMDSDITSRSIKGSTLKEHFDVNDLMMQEYVIEFKKVQTKTLAKKTITIENLTPLAVAIKTEVVNFPDLDVEESKLDKVLTELGIKKNYSYWDKQLDSQGILIKPVLNKQVIKMNEKLQIDIYVYADTFGIYADELLIDINDIAPFCVTILVEIVGCPIEFPIALNSIHPYPVLRFGNIHYKAHDVTRGLRMYNSSSIPISILWHVLLKDKPQNKEEFNVLFDLHGRNSPIIEDSEEISPDGDFIITRRYYGTSNQNSFKIFPTESTINPKTYLDVKITFSSKIYRGNITNRNLEAYLLGYIYMSESYISQSSLYTRPYGKHLPPIKILLTSTLELPRLKLNSISTENRFKFYATDVCASGGSSQSKDILFKNNSSTTAKVRMTANPPFTVMALKTRKFEMTDKEFIAVEPDEVLQVTIQCDFTLERVKEMAKVYFFNIEYHDEIQKSGKMTTTIIKPIYIEQRATVQQLFPLNLIILFPRIEVSVEELEFGYCLLGVEKMKLVTIFNPIGCKVPFRIEPPDDIYVKPTSGILPPCTGSGKGYIDIKVFFIPRIPGLFKEDIKFYTNLSDYTKTVGIYAVGSWDAMYQ